MSDPAWLSDYVMARYLDGDRYLVVMPLTFGRGRVAVANAAGIGDFY